MVTTLPDVSGRGSGSFELRIIVAYSGAAFADGRCFRSAIWCGKLSRPSFEL